MRRTKRRTITAALVGGALSLGGCGDGSAPDLASGPNVSIELAALNLRGVGDVVWDVEVVNGADPAQVVWHKRLSSTGYGDSAGSASYVGPCDADPGVNENTVKVWVVGVYSSQVATLGTFASGALGGATTPNVEFQNPTTDGALTQVAMCRENADVFVQFDVALMRPAQQGFFDIAVSFNNIFCSAKFDCCADTDANGCATDGSEDIELLFDAAGARSSTMVLGFACTAGATAGVETELYLDALQLDCTSPTAETFSADITLNPSGPAGNQCTAGADGMSTCTSVVTESNGVDADAYLYQVAIFRGFEQIQSGGIDARKIYWNVALGVKRAQSGLDITDCMLRTHGTADDVDGSATVVNGTVEAGAVYPFVNWDVDLATCGAEQLALGDPAAMVRPEYTAPGGDRPVFAYSFNGTVTADTGLPDGFAWSGSFRINVATNEVWVPAGDFWMGCNSVLDQQCTDDERPQHLVTLSAYSIDATEVTAAAYRACFDAGVCTQPSTTGGIYGTFDIAGGKQDHPINYVSWNQATTFCAWSGKPAGVQRLCTEAEWEKAARGGCDTVAGDCSDGSQMRKYPWDAGDGSAPIEPSCGDGLAHYDYCPASTLPVGSHTSGVSPYGAQDMAGSVAEWVNDWYSHGTYPSTPESDPLGPANGTYHVHRGGSRASTNATVRASKRQNSGPGAGGTLGFRCCRATP